jgi:hypothetical protein
MNTTGTLKLLRTEKSVRNSRGVRDSRYSFPPIPDPSYPSQVKAKCGSDAEEDGEISDTDSEDAESEDERGEELTRSRCCDFAHTRQDQT